MTSSITPNPAIHTMPALDSGEFTALDWQQLIAWGQTLLTEIEQAVAFALLNVSVLGVKPFVALQQFGAEVLGAATDLETLITAVGSGNIAGVVSAINNLTNDISALISGIGGTVIADVVTAINTSINNFIALISGIGGSHVSDVVNLLLKIEQIIDAIANALGHAGTGHLISDIQTYLGAIPSGNIAAVLGSANLGADMQAVVDKLANGLGHVGTGHTLANLLSYIGTIPGGNIASALSQTVIPTLTSGWGRTIDGSLLTGAISGSLISGFTSIEASINSELASLESEMISVLNGVGSGFLAVGSALNSIPFVNVIAPFFTNIGASVQGFVDAMASAFTQTTMTGTNPSQAAQAATAIVNVVNSTQTIVNGVAQTIANQAIANPASWGIDQTASASFNLLSLNGTTAPTTALTQASSVACYIDTPNGGVKQSVAWLGDGTITGFTAFYVNLYSVNTSTGVATWVWSSNNIISAISGGATPLWNYANIPAANYLNTSQGNKYVAELQVLGTGTYNIVGINGHWLNTNTSVTVGNVGCKRTSGPCINQSSLARFTAAGSSSSTKNPTWVHAYVSGDTVLVDITGYSTTSAITAFAVTFGGIAMTQIAMTANYETTGFGYIATYGLLPAALGALSTGNQTVTVATTGGGTTITQCNVVGTSSSYTNISAFGTAQTTSGASATPTQTVTGLTANSKTIVHSVLTSDETSAGWSSNNQNVLAQFNSGTGADALLLQDQLAYATSVVFTGTAATSARFGGVAVPLTSTVTRPLQVPTTFTPTASNNIPWMAMCGSTGISQVQATTKQFKTSGTTTYTVPTAAQSAAAVGATIKFDLAALGAGGGGDGYNGTGGGAGTWTTITLTYGVDIPLTTTSFTVSVGAGGTGGVGAAAAGTNGGATTVTITGYGTVTSAGGATGAGTASNVDWGASAGNTTFNGAPYYGGVEEPQLSQGGYAPGGGGAAGDPSFLGNGGVGAPGYAAITCYQM